MELRNEILSGQYGEHSAIGTHTQLAERFSVSLITIRKAVQTLEEDGLVEIRQGKGTFVRRTALVDTLHSLTGASNIMSSRHFKANILVPVFEFCKTPDWMDDDVQEGLGANTLFIRRIHSVSGKPIAHADLYLPGVYKDLITRNDIEQNTVYQIYQNKLGVALGKGRQIIRAAGADNAVAESLEIPKNWPVLQIERRAYDKEGKLIEYMLLSYEASKFLFEVELALSAE